jgi:hypothetical protein
MAVPFGAEVVVDPFTMVVVPGTNLVVLGRLVECEDDPLVVPPGTVEDGGAVDPAARDPVVVGVVLAGTVVVVVVVVGSTEAPQMVS